MELARESANKAVEEKTAKNKKLVTKMKGIVITIFHFKGLIFIF